DELRQVLRFLGDALRLHARPGDLDKPLPAVGRDLLRHLLQRRDGFLGRFHVTVYYYCRVNVLVEKLLRLLEESSCQHHGRGCPVSDLVICRLRDLDEHLSRGMLHVYLLEHRRPIIRDGYVAERVDEHLVHPSRSERCLHYLGDELRSSYVVALGFLSPTSVASFLENEDCLTRRCDRRNRCCCGHNTYSASGIQLPFVYKIFSGRKGRVPFGLEHTRRPRMLNQLVG